MFARDVHLMQMDYRVEDGRGISCSRAEGEELVSDQGFDELPAEVRTHHTFHYCAQQESKQRAQPRFQGWSVLLPPISSPAKAPRKGPRMMPQRHEEQPYDGAYEAAARSPPTASLYLLPSIGTNNPVSIQGRLLPDHKSNCVVETAPYP